MNSTIDNFTREQIKEGLKSLPDNWQLMFKRMYSHKNLEADIDEVVNKMPSNKLDWALSQVENSINKLNK